MFESLQEKLSSIFKKLRGKGKLTPQDVDTALREVRIALLEADVNLKVVRNFIARVKEKAVGSEIWESLSPGQLVIKFVKDELLELLGNENEDITLSPTPPTIVVMVGLNGAGKTTSSGKLAKYLKNNGHSPLLVAGDVYRPAAIKQLEVLANSIGVPTFTLGDKQKPVQICKGAISHALSSGCDVVIIDTAGRMQIDETLMAELEEIKNEINPTEILLTVDAMTGQDAVNIAQVFNERLDITGVILTKLDGDERGGAALSIKEVTGKPIKFVGMGEKLDALEPFHPDRIASRILGMGDILTLIDRAEREFSEAEALELEKKFRNKEFSLQDFLEQLQRIKKMGPIKSLLEMIPGFAQITKDIPIGDKQVNQVEAIIRSMTMEERLNPSILNASRKRRIANGSGTEVSDVNKLVKQYTASKKMFKQFADMEKMSKMGLPFRLPF